MDKPKMTKETQKKIIDIMTDVFISEVLNATEEEFAKMVSRWEKTGKPKLEDEIQNNKDGKYDDL